jgi:hypothetical protein
MMTVQRSAAETRKALANKTVDKTRLTTTRGFESCPTLLRTDGSWPRPQGILTSVSTPSAFSPWPTRGDQGATQDQS